MSDGSARNPGFGGAQPRTLDFSADAVNEQVVVAAAIASREFRDAAVDAHPPDAFLVPEHRAAWGALREAKRLGVSGDPATLARLSGGGVDVAYLAELATARPDRPDERTLAYAVEQLLWDRQIATALQGPIAQLLEALQRREPGERVRALARAVEASFDGWGERRHLCDPEQLVAEQMADVRARVAGRAVYPYGLLGLDFVDPPPDAPRLGDFAGAARRMIPGAAPGQVTVVTGCSGAGKTTVTARLVLGLMRQRRRVLYGAWEMSGGMTLELLACLSLGWNRSDLTLGRNLDEGRLAMLEQRMRELSRFVRFLRNPFRRGVGERRSNERNLDLVHGYVADAGCAVFVADLWLRCLVSVEPNDEQEALFRQQAMAEDLGVHAILVQQQRLKDIEARADKRPTREGIKGSGAWVEIADTILGVHRPALWKRVPDNVLEVDVLKQRYGRWPLAVEFDWDADRGTVSGGRSVEYDPVVTAGEGGGGGRIDRFMHDGKAGRGKRREVE